MTGPETPWSASARADDLDTERQQREAFHEAHPAWDAWRSVDYPHHWNATKIGALPPVILHAPYPEELSHKVTEFEDIESRLG